MCESVKHRSFKGASRYSFAEWPFVNDFRSRSDWFNCHVSCFQLPMSYAMLGIKSRSSPKLFVVHTKIWWHVNSGSKVGNHLSLHI